MKRITILVTVLLIATSLFAQDPITKQFKAKIFEIHTAQTHDIYRSLRGLGSGAPGSDMSYNDETRTITVRDYPENIATIEEAIGRLDKAAPPAADVELKVSMLIGSKTALPGAEVPEDLAPVVKQLQSTLRYSHYGLLAANLQHTRVGEGIEGSGVAEQNLVGGTAANPVFYTYTLKNIRVQDGTVTIENCNFGMRVPVQMSKGVQYEAVGFKTPVSIKQNEKVVIGTTTMGDRAVIVVLMAKVQ
jgi:type II/III secretion system protein